jgi:hypothetical protein
MLGTTRDSLCPTPKFVLGDFGRGIGKFTALPDLPATVRLPLRESERQDEGRGGSRSLVARSCRIIGGPRGRRRSHRKSELGFRHRCPVCCIVGSCCDYRLGFIAETRLALDDRDRVPAVVLLFTCTGGCRLMGHAAEGINCRQASPSAWPDHSLCGGMICWPSPSASARRIFQLEL